MNKLRGYFRKVIVFCMAIAILLPSMFWSNFSTASASPIKKVPVAAGFRFSLAVRANGTVSSWGYNNMGQLGNGSLSNSSIPVTVSGLNNIGAVAAGNSHGMAIKSDNTVWSWGLNASGQLGDGTTTRRLVPVQLTSLSNITRIVAGQNHSAALKDDGTVWTWGNNLYGQLGDGTNVNRSTPVQVQGLTNVIEIACGSNHTIALKNDGTVWTWGLNTQGQLGDGTLVNKNTPVQVPSWNNIVDVAAGCTAEFTMSLKDDGTVWSWGKGSNGQLGCGYSYPNSTIPVQATGLTSVTTITYSAAARNDGTVWQWGYHDYGTGYLTPVQVSGLSSIKYLSSSQTHTIAVQEDGSVWTWGSNSYGYLGDGTTTAKSTPVKINLDILAPVVSISSSIPGYSTTSTPTLIYTVNEQATVVVKVDGVVVNKVSGNNLDPLADGSHTVRVEATDTAGNQGFADATFIVDTILPTAELLTPQTHKGTIALVGSAMDANFSNYKLEYASQTTPSDWHEITSYYTPVNGFVLGYWDTTAIANGTYNLKLTVSDLAGFDATSDVNGFIVDNSIPISSISTPLLNADLKGVVSITGSASDEYLETYRLEYASDSDPTSWNTITESTVSLNNAALGLWNTTTVTDGMYNLRLAVVDKGGTTVISENSGLRVDNTSPQVTISAPISNAILEGSVDITGSVADVYLTSATLEYGIGSNPSSWTQLTTFAEPKTNATIFAWDTSKVLDGSYTLRFTGIDRVGNSGSALVSVQVINIRSGINIYKYDSLNRLEKVTYPNGQVVSYNYDSAGNLLSIIKTGP